MTEHTSRACRRCDAKCCRRFSLPFPKKNLRRWLITGAGSIGGAHAFLWALKWFRRIKRPPGEVHKYWYTCTLLDKKTNRCKHYELRPKVCREFLCSKAKGRRDS